MALITKAIKGTQDTLPMDSHKVRFLEATLADIAGNYGFREIRTPVFEHTELFNRSVGDTTDVVQKEMYTFDDKGGRSITLRPEGTAGAVRSFLEHGLFNEPSPMKVYYLTSCYRYEKPQAGRLREFHQFGVECFGTSSPAQDAEVIALADEVFGFLGVKGLELQINSIGCPHCRPIYQKALKDYFTAHKDELCETCTDRLERNPMRIIDCKEEHCKEICKGAPRTIDFLCDDCRAHFDGVKRQLNVLGIPFEIDPHIVRGLDYYTRTVFEFVSGALGAQSTVCGGGRYDGLLQELGGKPVPALGFGIGEELLKLIYENAVPGNNDLMSTVDLYMIPADDEAKDLVTATVNDLRRCGMNAERDVCGRSVKAQMKYAGKLGARFTMILGETELREGSALIKDMQTGDTERLPLEELSYEILMHIGEKYLAEMDEDPDPTPPDNVPGLTVLRGGKNTDQ